MENLFDYEEPLKTDNTLTDRQWRLYRLLTDNPRTTFTREQMLSALDRYYGYNAERIAHPKRQFVNMSCLRNLTKDIDAIVLSPTITLVYVGGRFCFNAKEAERTLLNDEIEALKMLAKMWFQRWKLSNDNQMRLVFNREKEVCEATIASREKRLQEIEETVQSGEGEKK